MTGAFLLHLIGIWPCFVEICSKDEQWRITYKDRLRCPSVHWPTLWSVLLRVAGQTVEAQFVPEGVKRNNLSAILSKVLLFYQLQVVSCFKFCWIEEFIKCLELRRITESFLHEQPLVPPTLTVDMSTTVSVNLLHQTFNSHNISKYCNTCFVY